MVKKIYLIVLVFLSLICTSLYVQETVVEKEATKEIKKEEAKEIEETEEEVEEEEPEEPEEPEEEPKEAEDEDDEEEPEETEDDEDEEPEDEAEPEEPEDDEGEDDMEGLGLIQTLQASPLLSLLEANLERIAPQLKLKVHIVKLREKFKKTLLESKVKMREFAKKLSTEGVKLPFIGVLKFVEYKKELRSSRVPEGRIEGQQEDEEDDDEGDDDEEGAQTPKYIGGLYDDTGKKKKDLKAGPLLIKNLKISIFPGSVVPKIDADISLFENEAKLVQENLSEAGAKFTLLFIKPLLMPVGLKKRAPIKELRLLISDEQKIITTETQLFEGVKELAKIKLNLSEPPFTFKVSSNNVPITVFAKKLAETPIKGLVLKKLNLTINLSPPWIQLYSETNLKDVKLGLQGEDMSAKLKAKIGARDFSFIFDLKNLKLPLKMGTIHKAQLRIGASE